MALNDKCFEEAGLASFGMSREIDNRGWNGEHVVVFCRLDVDTKLMSEFLHEFMMLHGIES